MCDLHGHVTYTIAKGCGLAMPLRTTSCSKKGGAITGIVGQAPAHLAPSNQEVAARCSIFKREPSCLRGCLPGDGPCTEARRPGNKIVFWAESRYRESDRVPWLTTLQYDPDTCWAAASESDVTAETVSKLCHQSHLTVAVEALGILVQADCCISKSLFYTVLKKCVVEKDLVLGRRVHALTVKHGYQSDEFLCNHILRMYSSYGRLEDATDVFNMVATPDAFMWSSIISAHVKHGQDKQAIRLYHRMCKLSVKPDGHVFVAALQACARGSHLKAGQQVHADLLASGLEPDLFVCNSLVDMYAKCGSLEDAQGVFDALVDKNVVTWNALLSGYSKLGRGQDALHLYSAMQESGVEPNSVTFLCLLQACASVGTPALEKGKQLHAQIRECGKQADMFVGNSLVNMYAKCGSLDDAQREFHALARKDVVTWTALIAGYSQRGMGQEALRLYSDMQEDGVTVPDSVTYVCLLQACASVGTPALEKGKQLHAEIRERGYQGGVIVANSLIQMYAKCGSLQDARREFDELSQRDAVTWTALIAGYSLHGMGQEALHLHSLMSEDGKVAPDCVTFVCLLQACASVGSPALEKGEQLHAQIRERGHQADVTVASSLVNMYAKCGNLDNAQRVFNGLNQKDVVTWTALIAGYCQQGKGQEALHIYSDMQAEGVAVPNSVTFVSLLQACACVGTLGLEKGKQLHAQIMEHGVETDVYVANSLLSMYAKCGSLEDARSVFDGLNQKDVVTWTALIAGYSQQGFGEEALLLYSAMQAEGSSVPNSVTFACLLQACASVGTMCLEDGKQLHGQIIERGHEADVLVGNSLVDMYAKCGSLDDAQRVFDGLVQKDVVTWTALITGYCQQGMAQEALLLYGTMQDDDLPVLDWVAFVCLLEACATVGYPALEMGKLLHAQIKGRGHEADVNLTSRSLVYMYTKCGSLEDARRVFDGLVEKSEATWSHLIVAYSQQGMYQEALALYRVMREEGIAILNALTFVCLLKACANEAALHLGRQLHAHVEEQGLQSNLSIAGSLINMYGKSGSMIDAQQVFHALADRDVFTWSALIAGYTCQGDSEVVFDSVQRMVEDGIEPVSITFLSVLTVCSHAGLLDKGREYFKAMSSLYSVTPTLEHYTCMVDLLGRAGRLDEALVLVRTMPVRPNAGVWHALLGACRKWSNVVVGCQSYIEAVKLDRKDTSAYVLMSNIYTSAQMWEQAQEVQEMRMKIGAWKQPGQSWWTDVDGLIHNFLSGDRKHSKGQAMLKPFFLKVKKDSTSTTRFCGSARFYVDCVTETACPSKRRSAPKLSSREPL